MRVYAIVAILLCCHVAGAQGVAQYACLRTDAPPVVDGRLDDACWQPASEAPVLYQTGLDGAPATNETRVRLLMDGQALYLCADAPTAPGKQPSAAARDRDGKTWNDDSLELFLSTDFTSEDYYHLTFNALGTQMDSRVEEDVPPEESIRWNADWQVATVPREGGWSAEAKIPWPVFGLDAAPPQGWVWRVKIGCVARGFQNSMWPKNSDQSFHNRDCWGYLIFSGENLALNPGFEAGIPEQGSPAGWQYAYYEKEGKGICSVVEGDAASGRFCGRLEKTDDKDWFPVLYTVPVPVQPGSTYEISAMARCDREFRMRYNLIGEAGGKRGVPVPATDGWQRVSMEATVPETGVKELQAGFQLIATTGVILIDDIMIRRRNELSGTVDDETKPHPFHNLHELASRTAFKPYELLQGPDGSFQADRVIFRDSATGAPVTMYTRSAGGSTRHTYMEISPWNADGSLLALTGGWPGKGTMMLPADGSTLKPLAFYASSPIWDRHDPFRLYFRKYRGHEKTDLWDLAIGNVGTGSFETRRRFAGDISLWPMSQDGEKLLVRETLVGDDGKPASRVWIMDRECNEGLELDPKGLVHQTWFTKLPDYSVEFEWEGQKPAGQYVIGTDGAVRKLFDQTYGHRAHSPDGNWLAIIGPCAIRDKRTGETRIISDEGSNHQTWEVSDDWYATSDSLYLKRVVVNGSPTVQRIGAHNSQLKHSTYWSEPHPEMSPDGTKLAYASSMLGDIDFYTVQMRVPDPPQQLTVERRGGQYGLKWLPGEHHAETAGYRVYVTYGSGLWGKPVTDALVKGTEYVVAAAQLIKFRQPGPVAMPFFYVTAVEHSGLESPPSNDAPAWTGYPWAPRSYLEAEGAKHAAPAVEVFDPAASNFYALLLGKLEASGPLEIRLSGDTYGMPAYLWVRVRARKPASLSAQSGRTDLGSVEVPAGQYTWLRFPNGDADHRIVMTASLRASAPGVVLDRLLLTSDEGFRPTGKGRTDVEAPTVTGLSAQPTGCYAARLSWQPAEAQDLSHYNVYCSTSADVQPVQERLIASPSATSYVDWGLQAGTEYHYVVTAVDRTGNEGPPTDAAVARTEALGQRVLIELDRPWSTKATSTLELPFTVPQETDFVVWGKVQSLNGERSGPIRLALDGSGLGAHSIAFDYICVGHGGPVLGAWLWDCLRPVRAKSEDPTTYHAAAGDHVLQLTAPEGADLQWEGFCITNDLGYRPDGTVSFLVGSER